MLATGFLLFSEIICTLKLYLHLSMIYLSSAFKVADITKHRVCVHNSWHTVYKECKSTYDAYMHLKGYENHFHIHICYTSLRLDKILDSHLGGLCFRSVNIHQKGEIIHLCTYMQYISKEWCTQISLLCVLLWLGTDWFYLYTSGLLYWHWSNHIIAPLLNSNGAIIWLLQCQ